MCWSRQKKGHWDKALVKQSSAMHNLCHKLPTIPWILQSMYLDLIWSQWMRKPSSMMRTHGALLWLLFLVVSRKDGLCHADTLNIRVGNVMVKVVHVLDQRRSQPWMIYNIRLKTPSDYFPQHISWSTVKLWITVSKILDYGYHARQHLNVAIRAQGSFPAED